MRKTGDAVGIPSDFCVVQAVEKPFAADQLIATVGRVANNHK
jgi:hypothetical protein